MNERLVAPSAFFSLSLSSRVIRLGGYERGAKLLKTDVPKPGIHFAPSIRLASRRAYQTLFDLNSILNSLYAESSPLTSSLILTADC